MPQISHSHAPQEPISAVAATPLATSSTAQTQPVAASKGVPPPRPAGPHPPLPSRPASTSSDVFEDPSTEVILTPSSRAHESDSFADTDVHQGSTLASSPSTVTAVSRLSDDASTSAALVGDELPSDSNDISSKNASSV